jgi:hypothetical protein
MSRRVGKAQIDEPPDALSAFARLFWDAAIEQVEREIEAEEKAANKSVSDKEEVS